MTKADYLEEVIKDNALPSSTRDDQKKSVYYTVRGTPKSVGFRPIHAGGLLQNLHNFCSQWDVVFPNGSHPNIINIPDRYPSQRRLEKSSSPVDHGGIVKLWLAK